MKYLSLFLLIPIISCTWAIGAERGEPQIKEPLDERLVVKAVIDDLASHEKSGYFLIRTDPGYVTKDISVTGAIQSCREQMANTSEIPLDRRDEIRKRLDLMPTKLAREFDRLRLEDTVFQEYRGIDHVKIISEDELDRGIAAYERKSGNAGNGSVDRSWEISKVFPGAKGELRFSRVGFDDNRTQAIVMYSYQCGVLCGEGRAIFLEKKGELWRMKTFLNLWEN